MKAEELGKAFEEKGWKVRIRSRYLMFFNDNQCIYAKRKNGKWKVTYLPDNTKNDIIKQEFNNKKEAIEFIESIYWSLYCLKEGCYFCGDGKMKNYANSVKA